jgi:excisionase family DNA binding protein
MANAIQKRLLTVKEAAGYLAMTAAAVYQKVHRDQIPVVRFGKTLRFDIQALDAWIEEHTAPVRIPA